MADKYRCYGKDDFGHPYDALSMKDEYGEWVRTEDYDGLAAELAALREANRKNVQTAMTAHERVRELEAALRPLSDMCYRGPLWDAARACFPEETKGEPNG